MDGPTNGPMDGPTWVGARDTCVSKKINYVHGQKIMNLINSENSSNLYS